MPSLYNGVGDLPSRPASVNIASSTNATPIVVTTSGAHSLTEGDEIQIAGHATNTAANGVWYAHIISSTQVSLLVPVTRANSTGNGVGGATGTVTSQNLSPTYNEPSDGDAGSAASVNVALSALGDRTAWISQRIGSHKLLGTVITGPIGAIDPPVASINWTTNAYTNATSVATLNCNLIPGDIVICRGMVCLQMDGNDSFTIKTQHNIGAGAADFTGQTTIYAADPTATPAMVASFALLCAETLGANVTATAYNLVLTGKSLFGTASHLLSNSYFEIVALRPN